MKLRIIVLVLLILMLFTVVIAAETAQAAGPITDIFGVMPYLVALVSAFISFAIGRFFKWRVDVGKIIPIVTTIVKAIFKIEELTYGTDPPKQVVDYDEYRSRLAAQEVEKHLPLETVPMMKKVFGNTMGAIKIIFPYVKPALNIIKTLKKK